MFQAEIKSKFDEDISILVQLDNHPWNYLCECGDASGLSVKELQSTNAIFISHTHIDHFVNFDSVVRHQIGVQRRVVICGPEGIAKQIQSRILSYTWNLIQQGAIVYEIRELSSDQQYEVYEIEPPIWELKSLGTVESNEIFRDKSFTVSALLLNHKIPSMAYRFDQHDTVKIDIQASKHKGGKWVKELKTAFETGEKEAKIEIEGAEHTAESLFHLLHLQRGDSLGIIMDHAANTENHNKIKAHFFQCNRVLIESFYQEADKEAAEANFHSYTTQSAEIMKQSEVTEAVPVHFSRKYNEDDILILEQEFYTVFQL